MPTRRQHHVWCHYLRSWSTDNNRVNCIRDGKLFSTDPKNIMVEKDFYKLVTCTKEDIKFFKYWLNHKCEPVLRSANHSVFVDFMKIAYNDEVIHRTEAATDVQKADSRNLVIEAEERLHRGIEHSMIPIMDELQRERLDFLNCENKAMEFYHFIAHQFFRTKEMREKTGEILANLSPEYDFSRLRHLFCFCFANNFGGSLYVDRNRIRIMFLRNCSSGFITGDQPIVNLVCKDSLNHDDVALYYPLSPHLAIVVTFKQPRWISVEVTDEIVQHLNQTIHYASNCFLIASSISDLKRFKHKPSKKPNVLDQIVGLVRKTGPHAKAINGWSKT